MGRGILKAIGAIERTACAIAFVVMTGALMWDVFSRMLFGAGVLGAPQVGVIGMIAVAMFGIGVAAAEGAHLRPRFLDFVIPKRFDTAAFRIADAVTAGFFALLAVLSVIVVRETYLLGDVTSVLRWPLWPLQSILVAAFGLATVRYAIYALDPTLRPSDDVEESAGGAAEGDAHG